MEVDRGMQLLEEPRGGLDTRAPERSERAARRSLRAQIAQVERELADAFVTAYRMGGLELPAASAAEARLLSLGELEQVRDDLAERLRAARVRISERADEFEANRIR